MKLNFKMTVKALSITQEEFGKIINVAGTTRSKYLKNPKELRIKHIELLSKHPKFIEAGLQFEDLVYLTLKSK